MKKLIIIPGLCLVIACGNYAKNNNKVNADLKTDSAKKTDSIKKIDYTKQTVVADTLPAKPKKEDLRAKLIGAWADSVGGNGIFQIDKKTFFYPDNQGSYSYKFIGDSIQVHYDGHYTNYGWKFKGDNILVLTGPDGVTPFYRMKE